MLNKQVDDPDLAGVGAFVEENFANVGIGDHPVQALNALNPGASISVDITRNGRSSDSYQLKLLSGQGKP